MLIFKGREELEIYLTLHKQRHHAVRDTFNDAPLPCTCAALCANVNAMAHARMPPWHHLRTAQPTRTPTCVPSIASMQITEYLDPVIKKNTKHTKEPPKHSAFLSDFLTSNYIQPTGK
jgi:hypothetical protein